MPRGWAEPLHRLGWFGRERGFAGRGPHRQRQGLPAVVEGVLEHHSSQHVGGVVVVPDVVLKVLLRGKAASCGRAASCPSTCSTWKLGHFGSFSVKDCKCPGFSRALHPCPQSPDGFRGGQRDWLPQGRAAPRYQGGGVSGESWRQSWSAPSGDGLPAWGGLCLGPRGVS